MRHWLRKIEGFKTDEWYDPYTVLNKMPEPIPLENLKNIQIAAIQNNNESKEKEIEQLNNFLNGLRKEYNNFPGDKEFFQAFLSRLNTGFSQVTEGTKPNPEFISEYEKSITNFVDIIATYSGQEIPESISYDLQRIVAHMENGNFYGFIKRKSQFWEDIGTWILSCSGFHAIGTGPMIDAAGKQLIQDSVGYLSENLPTGATNSGGFLNIKMRFTGTKDIAQNKILYEYLLKEAKEKVGADSIQFQKDGYVSFNIDGNISGFTDLIEQANHELDRKITVKINDTLKEKIAEGLSVQAKSGAHQSLLNNMKRDQINSAQLKAWDDYLAILDSFYIAYGDSFEDIPSEEISAYANWIFSKHLAETTLGKNTFFLSHYGFSTLDDIMDQNGIMFTLAPSPNTIGLVCSTGVFDIEETSI